MSKFIFILLLVAVITYANYTLSRQRKFIAEQEARKLRLEAYMQRCDEVFALRMALIRAALCAPGGAEERMAIVQSVSYDSMLNSTKPVIPQSFYTQEQLQALLDSVEGEIAVERVREIINLQ